MKHYTSKFLKVVAWIYLVFPVTYLAIATVLFDIPMTGVTSVLLSPLYYACSAVSMLAGYGLKEMRRWAWYLLWASAILIAYQNAVVVHEHGETHHKALAYILSLILLAAALHRIAKEVRVPYFFPKIRWWESNPRYKLSVPVKLKSPGRRVGETDQLIDGEILDLSLGGCFVKLRSELKQDESVSLSFKVFGLPIECKGAVVWRTQSTVTHPKGVGIKFALETRNQKRALRQINSRLRKIAALYRRSRYLMSQDEFLKRLDELEKREAQDSA